jgi:hypothetical protein
MNKQNKGNCELEYSKINSDVALHEFCTFKKLFFCCFLKVVTYLYGDGGSIKVTALEKGCDSTIFGWPTSWDAKPRVQPGVHLPTFVI